MQRGLREPRAPDAVLAAAAEVLAVRNICKSFPGVRALEGVSFDLRAGEVHALCGENGAGKSTLMKIMSGQFRPDSGNIHYRGREVRFQSTLAAQTAGIAMIHQELNLVPHLSVAENIFLAREPRNGWFIDRKRLNLDAQRWLDRLGVGVRAADSVASLPLARQQLVEIAKALSMNAAVLIMDEPTSALSESEIARLFAVIRELKAGGVAIVYVSHRLDEMAGIVDRVTVLRDGRHVCTGDFAATTVDAIVAHMVGRSLDEKFPQRTSVPTEDVLLSVDGLTRKGVFGPVSFTLKRGEILGFAGLVGAGRSEVARAIFGADPCDGGTVCLGGRTLQIRSPVDAIRSGIAYLSEDRKAHGLAVNMSVAHNITMANMAKVSGRFGFIRGGEEQRIANHYVRTLGIRTPDIRQITRLLSGGNQQKVVIGKWLFREPSVLFFDEPTRGIDVAAKYAIYQLLDQLAARGIGVVLISSELPEILGMTDRVAVFHEGRLTTLQNTRETTQEDIMQYASGRKPALH